MPNLSSTVTSLRASVFASINARMRTLSTPPICLHIGDTYAVPPDNARWEHMDLEAAHFYRYSHPFGTQPLLQEVAEKLQRENGIAAEPDWVQITCGATQALHCAVHTLLEPGDGVLLLAPYWPLFGGMVRCLGAQPLEVDCTTGDLAEQLQTAYKPHVRAVYFSNPNNPDGRVYTRDELAAIADFARHHDLWIISDECYEHYLYDGRQHLSIASLAGMAERTVSCFSFSKSYAMAGHRLGYAVATPAVAAHIRRFANHTVYNVSESIQRAGAEMLSRSAEFTQTWLPAYERARDRMEETFARWGGRKPQGGAYYFLDLGTPERAWDLLERALDAGVVFAPGAAFGENYAHRLRVCFTCVDEPTLERAKAILDGL